MNEGDRDRRARAEERRSQLTLRRTRLQAVEDDLAPVRGAAALSLVHRLTLTSWSLAGHALPVYARHEIPCRFVRGRLT